MANSRSNQNYLGGKLNVYSDIVNAIMSNATANATPWSIDSSAISLVATPLAVFNAAYLVGAPYGATKSTRSPAQAAALKSAKSALNTAIRPFVKSWIKFNPHITDAEKVQMHINITDPSASKQLRPAPVALCQLSFSKSTLAPNQIRCHYKAVNAADPQDLFRGKPLGVKFAKMIYAVGPDATTVLTASQCSLTIQLSKTGAKTGKLLVFTDSQNLKLMTAYGTWVDNKGLEGPLTGPFTMLIS